MLSRMMVLYGSSSGANARHVREPRCHRGSQLSGPLIFSSTASWPLRVVDPQRARVLRLRTWGEHGNIRVLRWGKIYFYLVSRSFRSKMDEKKALTPTNRMCLSSTWNGECWCVFSPDQGDWNGTQRTAPGKAPPPSRGAKASYREHPYQQYWSGRAALKRVPPD